MIHDADEDIDAPIPYRLPASCFTEQTSGEPREILDVVRRGALATETYVFECDEAVGSIEVRPYVAFVVPDGTCDSLGRVAFVSTDGELRA